ncbi:MAG: hypothetical protein AABX29_07790 [Nanoarchaeota archaeon]
MEEKNKPETLDEITQINPDKDKPLTNLELIKMLAISITPGSTFFPHKYMREDRTFFQKLEFETERFAWLVFTGACAYVACNALRGYRPLSF